MHHRECELSEDRQAGNTGSQTNYNQLARELPQHSRIAVIYVEEEPEGWADWGYGPWPEGGILLVKSREPPSYRSWRLMANWHTGG